MNILRFCDVRLCTPEGRVQDIVREDRMKLRLIAAALSAVSVVALSLGGAAQAEGAKRTYYYASQLQGHPYLLDSLLGVKYAAQKFNVNVVPIGPQGWD